MDNCKIFLIFLTIVIFSYSCTEKRQISSELQEVIDHYSKKDADSLKLRAALFLIENIQFHHYRDSKELDNFYSFLDTLFTKESYFFRLDSLYKDYAKEHPSIKTRVYSDEKHVKSSFLIENIDKAFDYWEKPWNKHLTFEQFCEYVLPYRIDDEILEPWRLIFYEKYKTVVMADTLVDVETICNRLIDELKKQKMQVHYNRRYIEGLKPSILSKMKFGTCKDYCNLSTFVMRSFGVPVAIDFIPSAHSWNALITPTGVVDFTAEQNLRGHLIYWKLPKVYRQTFSINKESLYFQCGKEKIPPFFQSPFFKDVTSEYFEGANIEIDILENKKKFVYLCVCYRNTFHYVDWARVENGKAIFRNMGDSVIYFPRYFTQGRGIDPYSYPVRVLEGKKVFTLKPDTSNLQQMVLYRKFPVKEPHKLFLKRAVGGIFEGANRADFSDAIVLYKIDELPEMRRNFVDLPETSFRYVRYLAPKGSYCSMAEIEFFEKESKIPLKGKILGTDGCYVYSPNCTKDKVFDGDLLTYYDAKDPNDAWVGLDFGEQKKITSLSYITRNDDNAVHEGDKYELLYMDLYGWKSMGQKIADADTIIYNNVPSNAVYLLKNLTRGKEEAIFTYEQGKQVW